MALNFTHIPSTGDFIPTSEILDISLSERTIQERSKLKGGIDNFATFKWCGYDMFNIFGAFIINKDNLKFYNGPTFTNQYVNPQFESAAAQLTGVNFKPQVITFTMGVYWISEEDYRKLIYLLNPYEINTLMFNFDEEHYYQVKLSSRENGIRYIVGKENRIKNNQTYTESMYYTEIQLSFEVQGAACAYNSQPFNIEGSLDETNTYIQTFSNIQDAPDSDLAFPFVNELNITLTSNLSSPSSSLIVNSIIEYVRGEYESETIDLFNVVLTNLTWSQLPTNPTTYSSSLRIRYNSESGLLTWSIGDDEYELLTGLTTSSTGKRIVKSLTTKKYTFPGKFDDPNFDLGKIKIKTNISIDNTIQLGIDTSYFESRGRTNLI